MIKLENAGFRRKKRWIFRNVDFQVKMEDVWPFWGLTAGEKQASSRRLRVAIRRERLAAGASDRRLCSPVLPNFAVISLPGYCGDGTRCCIGSVRLPWQGGLSRSRRGTGARRRSGQCPAFSIGFRGASANSSCWHAPWRQDRNCWFWTSRPWCLISPTSPCGCQCSAV